MRLGENLPRWQAVLPMSCGTYRLGLQRTALRAKDTDPSSRKDHWTSS